MKTIIALLAVATCCLAAEAPYSPAGSKAQGALLLLPLQQSKENNNNSTSTTPRSVADGIENLEDVNAKLSEKLKQEQGSQQGVYHVYLQDGRLQKVQYTTTPITSSQQTQQQQYTSHNYNQQQQFASNNYNQQQQYASNNYNQQQAPEVLSPEFAERRGAYIVQVPQERIQAFQNYARQASQETAQVPQFQSTSSQYNQGGPEEAVVRYLPVPLTGEAEQYNRQEAASGHQAVVQYSEVQPIEGPVYSYRPEAVTRILRYAPVY